MGWRERARSCPGFLLGRLLTVHLGSLGLGYLGESIFLEGFSLGLWPWASCL